MNLTRKIGPLPLWAWALIVLVVGYFLYKRFAATGSTQSASVPQNTSQPAQDSSGSTGLAPTAGSPTDTGQTTSDLVSALGGQQASLLAALEQANQDVVGLAQSQISALQQGTTAGPFQTQTQPLVGSQPGGSNAPVMAFVSPTVTGSVSTPAAALSATRSSAASSSGGQPFGGVVSTTRTKTGTVITKYASGRIVEQAPGKSAYVARA